MAEVRAPTSSYVTNRVEEHEPGSPHAVLAEVLDSTIERFASGAYEAAVARARSAYDERRGRVFEDEELWESWAQAFLEDYVIERALPPEEARGQAEGEVESPRVPMAHSVLTARAAGNARHEAAAMAWLSSQRSLFEVRGVRAGHVELVDLLGGASFLVRERRNMAGVGVGDVAELRLIGFEGEVLFGRTFCFHPRGTRDAIAAHARRIRGQGGSWNQVMDHCASLLVRCQRYRHVPPVRIYESVGRPESSPRAGA